MLLLMTDIRAMFYQVRLAEEDKDFLRFLWWPGGDVTQDVLVFRMTVHLFGAVSSPSCACFALRRTAKDNQHCFNEEAIDTVHTNFYMDDCLKSLPTEYEAIQMVKDLKTFCHKGGFHLTQWVSNSCEVLQNKTDPPTVTYLRLQNCNNVVNISFLLGKARVAPLKPVTIPRLELTAAVLAIRIDKMLREQLQLQLENSCFWTDSTSVLKYIRNENKRFRTFVANRISAIREASDVTQWRYIHSSQNPADDASRGMTVQQLITNKRWLNGPEFLREPVLKWSNENIESNIVDDDPELKKELSTNVLSVEDTDNATHKLINYFSDWKRLKTAVAWILKVKKVLLEVSCQRKQLISLNDSSDLEQRLQQTKTLFVGQCLSSDDLSEVEMLLFSSVNGKSLAWKFHH